MQFIVLHSLPVGLIPIERLRSIFLYTHSQCITLCIPFSIVAKVSWVRVSDVKVLTMNAMEETNEELPDFTIEVNFK